jgi:RluA family pseudouridine synthase
VARPVRFRVVPQEEGMMLGHLLARRLPGTSLEQGKSLVRAGAVYMGHLRIRVPTARVAAGERISVWTEALAEQELPVDVVNVVWRDEDVVVLDKPAGVAVAATRQSARGTLSEALRRTLEAEGVLRPYVGIVHRLDRGASGLVLFTVRSVANTSVHKQFVEHAIDRRYRVRVHGEVPETYDCDAPLLEMHSGTSKVAPGNPHSRDARTHFRRLEPAVAIAGTSLVEATLETGRHHQIRVHTAHRGHAVLGDRRYGSEDGAERLHLHAAHLRLTHPQDGRVIEVAAVLPEWARAVDDSA